MCVPGTLLFDSIVKFIHCGEIYTIRIETVKNVAVVHYIEIRRTCFIDANLLSEPLV